MEATDAGDATKSLYQIEPNHTTGNRRDLIKCHISANDIKEFKMMFATRQTIDIGLNENIRHE
jgi:CCR4-NOT transcriptional regulation complex NOT5 subunit